MTRKKLLIFLTVITAFFTLVILAVAAYHYFGSRYGSPHVKGDLYRGDHITLHLSVNIDRKVVPLSDLTVTCNGGGEAVAYDDGLYKTRGGDYGMYAFEVCIPAGSVEGLINDITIELEYLNANDWYIADIYCDTSLSEFSGGYRGTVDIDTQYNDGTRDQFTKYVVTDDENMISFMWGIQAYCLYRHMLVVSEKRAAF